MCRDGARRPAGQLQICEPGWPGKGPAGVRAGGIIAILAILAILTYLSYLSYFSYLSYLAILAIVAELLDC